MAEPVVIALAVIFAFFLLWFKKTEPKDINSLGIKIPLPKGNFTGPVDLRMVDIWSSTKLNRMVSKTGAVLLRDLTWQINYGDDTDTVTAPVGSVTDGASVPRIFWFISGNPKFGATAKAAYVHDILYGFHRTDQGRHISRAEADKIFREALIVLGLARWRAWLCWLGLRVGGRGAYKTANSAKPWGHSKGVANEVSEIWSMIEKVSACKPEPDPDCFCECCNTRA